MLRKHALALIILTGHLLLFSSLNLLINPHPDMLDHWVWSRHLALSYYEHPPMVAWAIRLITLIGGNSEVALELGAQFYNLTILFLSYILCYHCFGRTAAIFNLILLESTPYYSIGSIFLHIDQPFLICWLAGLYCLLRFHQTRSSKWLILLGICAGFGALSKYIMILFYIGLGLHLLAYKECRHHFKNPWLYVAGCLSLLIFSPVLIWNYQNQWVSFQFQFKRGLSGAPFGQNFFLFTLGHLALFSLVWSWWGLRELWRQRPQFSEGTKPESIILLVSLVPLTFFTLMSFRGSIADPHWANVSYLGIFMLVSKKLASDWETQRRKWIQRMTSAGLILNFAMIIVLFIHVQYPLIDLTQYQLKYFSAFYRKGIPMETIQKLRSLEEKPPIRENEFRNALKKLISPEEMQSYQDLILKTARSPEADLTTQFLGLAETGAQLEELLRKTGNYPIDYIISKEFQLSSALSFYLPNHPFPHSIQKPERNQWSPPEEVQRKKAIVVCHPASCRNVIKQAQERFQLNASYLGEFTTYSHRRIVRELEVYTLLTQ